MMFLHFSILLSLDNDNDICEGRWGVEGGREGGVRGFCFGVLLRVFVGGFEVVFFFCSGFFFSKVHSGLKIVSNCKCDLGTNGKSQCLPM